MEDTNPQIQEVYQNENNSASRFIRVKLQDIQDNGRILKAAK